LHSWKGGALSASKKLERLRSVYRFALGRKWVPANLATELKAPELRDKPTLPFFDEEIKRIFKSASDSEDYAADASTRSC
jgi:site-specific recombinase XerD